MNSDYISYSLPKTRKEIKLYLITLHKIQLVSGQSWPCQKSSVHIVQGLALETWALAHGLVLLFFIGGILGIRKELKGHKWTCVFSLWTKQKYILFMWTKWKITPLETWVQFVSFTQECYQFQYIKFLKLLSMKSSLYEWSKIFERSVSVVLNHFWFVDYFVCIIED